MKLIAWLRNLFKNSFNRNRRQENSQAPIKNEKTILKELEIRATTERNEHEEDRDTTIDEPTKEAEVNPRDNSTPLLSKEIFQFWQIDFNEYRPFLPNWGELDPTVSTISNGREIKTPLNFLYDQFTQRYGSLTTDLGYGLIYSIVMNAIEQEDRSVSSALREAIVRSNDPLLCVAVVKDYCQRKSILFDKYERITLDIIKKREAFYSSKSGNSYVKSPIDFTTLPLLPQDEQHELNKSSWLFNATLVEIYPKPETKKAPLYLMIKIPTLKSSLIVREFNRERYWKLNQNLVVQLDDGEVYRVLDIKGKSSSL